MAATTTTTRRATPRPDPRPWVRPGKLTAAAAVAFATLTAAVAIDGTWGWEQRGSGPYVQWAVAAGSVNTAAIALAAAAVVALLRRNRRLAVTAFALGAATVATPVLQMLIGRADTPGGWLYPSGHATGAIVAGALLYLTAQATTSSTRARSAAAVAAATVAAVGATAAVICGTHYPTDAAGSALWVAAWAAAAATVNAVLDHRGSRDS